MSYDQAFLIIEKIITKNKIAAESKEIKPKIQNKNIAKLKRFYENIAERYSACFVFFYEDDPWNWTIVPLCFFSKVLARGLSILRICCTPDLIVVFDFLVLKSSLQSPHL